MKPEEKLLMGDEKSLSVVEGTKEIKTLSFDPATFNTDWTLHYKAVHNVSQLYFKGPEEKNDAIALGQRFCAQRNWRFIQVRPFFSDILAEPQTEEERARFQR